MTLMSIICTTVVIIPWSVDEILSKVLFKVVLTFESVDEILKSEHSSEI